MEMVEMRRQVLNALLDALESLAGEELLTVVTRDEDGVLTPWVMYADAELLGDTLNAWMDNAPWNSPKSL